MTRSDLGKGERENLASAQGSEVWSDLSMLGDWRLGEMREALLPLGRVGW
jgi:hypothetical protein